MQDGSRRTTGVLLVAAATSFWIGWALMPGVGITDATLILESVAAHRSAVLVSSALHLVCATLFAVAIPGLARFAADGDRALRLAPPLLAVGACAIAADAIFHFAAYEMTAPGVDRAAVFPVMVGMQTRDLAFLVPMVLALFLGAGALAGGASRAGCVSRWNPRLHGVAFAVALTAGPLLGPRGHGRAVGLTFLALISASVAWVGAALARGVRA
jgi:hypothetical protein